MKDAADIGDWSDANYAKAVARMREVAESKSGVIVRATCGAWSLCFSIDPVIGNVFSAKVRRSTKERDWRILGEMSKCIGAPESAMPDTVATDARATHYFVWGGSNPDAARSALAALRGAPRPGDA